MIKKKIVNITDKEKIEIFMLNTQEIIDVIIKKGATNPCSRCNAEVGSLLNGAFSNTVDQIVGTVVVPGNRGIPSFVVICGNCGHISQYAVGCYLDLLPELAEKKT